MAFNVPDGYFESLQDRLSEVSRREVRPVLRRKIPYMAVAAGLAAVIVAGGFFLYGNRSSDALSSDEFYEELMYSDLIPVSDPESVFMTVMQDSFSDDYSDTAQYGDSDIDYDQEGYDALEYLIYSGISAEDVAVILSGNY